MRLQLWTAVLALAAVSACGGAGGAPSPSAQQPPGATSVKDALSNMEASGATPALDRSTSVAGPDTNANGVRDDVEAYVASLADSATQKRALLGMSKALTTAMTTVPSDATALRRATALINNAVDCLWQRYPADQASGKLLEMRKVTVNTRSRYDAYAAYNAAVAGTVVTLPRDAVCD